MDNTEVLHKGKSEGLGNGRLSDFPLNSFGIYRPYSKNSDIREPITALYRASGPCAALVR